MRTSVIISVLVLLLVFVSCSGQVGTLYSTPEGLSVCVEGEAKAVPDQLQVKLSLGAIKNTVQEAMSALEEKHKSVINALEAAGINTGELKMTGYNVSTEYRWDGGVQSIAGYRSNKDFSLNLDFSPEMLLKVYESLGKVSSNSSTYFSFDVCFAMKDPSALEAEALSSAIEKARKEADFIARAAGVRLKGIISITPDQISAPAVLYRAERSLMMMDAANASGQAPVNANDVCVKRCVTVVWSIKR